jgi:hypothetical protein
MTSTNGSCAETPDNMPATRGASSAQEESSAGDEVPVAKPD